MPKKRTKKRKTNQFNYFYIFGLLFLIAILLAVILLTLPRPNSKQVEPYRQTPLTETDSPKAPSAQKTEISQPTEPPPSTQLTSSSSTSNSSKGELLTSYIHKKGKLAIVLDDAGHNLSQLEKFLNFKGKLTIAVLPGLPYSKRSAELAHQAGKQIILHQPFQPLGLEDPGPGAIEVTFSRSQIEQILKTNLAEVPYARGINNHMGSLATQDRAVMDAVFSFLEKKNLFFLDSKTVHTTVVKDSALAYKVPYLERDLFLDVKTDRTSIKQALEQGLELAFKRGKAILIGHIQHTYLADFLIEGYEEYLKAGIEFVFVSELLNEN